MNETRKYWLDSMIKIVDPVFRNLAEGTLKRNLPNRFYGKSDRTNFGCLEAFGRAFCGFAPFISYFDGRSAEEEAMAEKYRVLITRCLDRATNPASPDYMNFGQVEKGQPLVDAAFLCHGLYRSGDFAKKLPDDLKKQIVEALKHSRSTVPYNCNWILFSCMVELGIDLLEGESDILRVIYGVRQHEQWYKGDGVYGDGAVFHMDFYNSYVIIPMLLDLCRYFAPRHGEIAAALPNVTKRAARYSEILERMISCDGTYAFLGRSICYRFGAFQILSQSMLEGFSTLSPASVRCALTAVIKRIMDSGIFDENGWLLHGIYGEQPSLAEEYICTGSLYLCSAVFISLGLPENDRYWADPDEKWTSLRIASGEDVMRDHSI